MPQRKKDWADKQADTILEGFVWPVDGPNPREKLAEALRAAANIAGIYFEIAEETIGEDAVCRRFRHKFDESLEAQAREMIGHG